MKTNWPTKKLGEVCEIITGGTPKTSVKDFYGDEFLWAGPSDLNQGVFVTDTNKKLSKKGFRESGIRIVPKDSVMMSCIGYIGKVGIASEEMATNQQINTFVPNQKILDSKYLYYALIFKAEEFQCNSSQTTLPIINKTKCLNIEIPLPPLSTQKEIVKMLDEKMGKIAEAKRLRAEALADTEKILSQTLHEIFEEGKKGWEEKTISNACIVQSGGTPSKTISEYWDSNDIPWLRSESCRDKKVESAQLFISKNGFENSSAKLLKPRTTLIALVGATIGKTGFTTFESTTNQNIAGLYPLDESVLFPEYLFIVAQNLYSHFTSLGSGKFKMANLSFVKSLPILIPPLAEQQKIVSKLDALSEKVRTLRDLQTAQLADLKSLERAHLREAFNGELV